MPTIAEMLTEAAEQRAELEKPGIASQLQAQQRDSMVTGLVTYRGMLTLLSEAIPHVKRQREHGKHEQDREDAGVWLQQLQSLEAAP